jgi:hypothetical protein
MGKENVNLMNINENPCSSENSESCESNYKTELCKTWVEKNFCPYKDKCRFAHGKKELHERLVNCKFYKLKECNSFFQKGFCPYGSRCHFKHDERKLQVLSRSFHSLLLNSEMFHKRLQNETENETENETVKSPRFNVTYVGSRPHTLSVFSNFHSLPQFHYKLNINAKPFCGNIKSRSVKEQIPHRT